MSKINFEAIVTLADESLTTCEVYFNGDKDNSRMFLVAKAISDTLRVDDAVLISRRSGDFSWGEIKAIHKTNQVDPDSDGLPEIVVQRLDKDYAANLKKAIGENVEALKDYRRSTVKHEALAAIGAVGFQVKALPLPGEAADEGEVIEAEAEVVQPKTAVRKK